MGQILVIAQIVAICVHLYLILLEKKYCSHCYWWSSICMTIFIIISFIPVVGLFTSIAGCADYTRNITKELENKKQIITKIYEVEK